MNKKLKLSVFLFVIISFVHSNPVCAQDNYKTLSTNSIRYTDSLMTEFRNTVYSNIYNPTFWTKCPTPTFTVLKIDIDAGGSVTKISFSDSADSTFLRAYSESPKYHNDKLTLEKYANAKSYKNVSILLPVNFEPLYSLNYKLQYKNIDSLMKFNKQDFTGNAIILPLMDIKILSEHNM